MICKFWSHYAESGAESCCAPGLTALLRQRPSCPLFFCRSGVPLGTQTLPGSHCGALAEEHRTVPGELQPGGLPCGRLFLCTLGECRALHACRAGNWAAGVGPQRPNLPTSLVHLSLNHDEVHSLHQRSGILKHSSPEWLMSSPILWGCWDRGTVEQSRRLLVGLPVGVGKSLALLGCRQPRFNLASHIVPKGKILEAG